MIQTRKKIVAAITDLEKKAERYLGAAADLRHALKALEEVRPRKPGPKKGGKKKASRAKGWTPEMRKKASKKSSKIWREKKKKAARRK